MSALAAVFELATDPDAAEARFEWLDPWNGPRGGSQTPRFGRGGHAACSAWSETASEQHHFAPKSLSLKGATSCLCSVRWRSGWIDGRVAG